MGSSVSERPLLAPDATLDLTTAGPHIVRSSSGYPWTAQRIGLIALVTGAMLLMGMGLRDESLQLIVAGVLGVVIGCAVGGYRDNWVWTGIGPFSHPNIKKEQFERGKTLWDVLQILVVPAVLTLGVVWFNDRQTAADRSNVQVSAWNSLLDGYLSQVSDLMLKHNLGPHASSTVREIARARTVTTLSRLDNSRRALLVRFLSESNLMGVVNLSIAPLTGVNLSGIDLTCDHPTIERPPHMHRPHFYPSCAGLSYASLNDANLSYADLAYADLSYANLSHANLAGADTRGVRWRHTLCPDGTNSARNHTVPESCRGHLKP